MAVKTGKPMVLQDSLFFVVDVLHDAEGLDLAKAEAIAHRIGGFRDVDATRLEIRRIAREEMGLRLTSD